MGLASSQARLLNLTARMHDIEYKAQNLEAQKLQMANESTQVYKEYENALNRQKVQFKHIGTDGSSSYKDANLQTLINSGYRIKLLDPNTGKWQDFITLAPATGEIDLTGNTTSKVNDVVRFNNENYVVTAPPSPTNVARGRKLASKIDITDIKALRNLVEAGFIVFEKPTNQKDEAGNIIFAEVNIATDTNLQEVSDETELKKAEAKYEADMRKIDAKDKKFDTDLAAMESERNAIKTEIDTLKSVAKDNVDRTFKLFS